MRIRNCGKSRTLQSVYTSCALLLIHLSYHGSLGMFTQDLAQELNVNARAVDLVLEHAREGNTALTEQEARAVMGRLGLSDEKALRLVGDLSGGEKARVALSMFGLKPNNLLVLDEPRFVCWKAML